MPPSMDDPILRGGLWRFRDGTTLRPIAGGADGDAGDAGDGGNGDGGGAGGAGGEPEDVAGLKSALDAERKARQAEERKRKGLERQLGETKTRLDEAEGRSKTDQEKAIDQARREAEEKARKEVFAQANERLVRAEVRAQAAGRLADPDDAVRLLDLSGFSVGDDGEIDSKPIAEAIEELVKAKPYLAADAKPRPTGSGDGGPRGGKPPAPEVRPGPERVRAALAEHFKDR